jgi:GNAT superfamily N-acetyltransferase
VKSIDEAIMRIVKLTKSRITDWLNYFDNDAFKDNADWKSCYCTYYYKPKPSMNIPKIKGNREYAIWLLDEKKMMGYLVYKNDKVIGWCCVNTRDEFPRLIRDIGSSSKRTLSIVCFIIEKDYRNQGIANKTVDRIIKDAKKQDYQIIEAYPNKKAINEYMKCHGSYSMYLSHGFIESTEKGKTIMRIAL